MKAIQNNKITIGILLMILLISCDSKRVFDDYKSVPNGSWNKNKKISFTFSITDTLVKRNLFINLRNNNNYAFSNLFLITEMKFPDKQKIIDTLEYDMADKTGKFLGEGFTEIKENKLFYKEQIVFPTTGEYTISISQAMRKNGEVEGLESLKGITDVGFRIEKTE